VLITTTTPLFFLWVQLVAVVLFLVSDAFRLLPDRLTFEVQTCKGLRLVSMVGLNVVVLRFAFFCQTISAFHIMLSSTVSAITL
jgi:solute carrier family 35 (GDP-fucose transporter), member C1